MNSKKKFIISMLVVSFVLLSIIATVAIAFALTQQTIKTSLNIGYTVEDIDGTATATFTIGGVTENLTAMKGTQVIGDTLVFKAGDKEDAGNLMFPEDALALTSQNDNVVIQYTYTNSGSKHYVASMSLDSNIDQENMKIEYSINGTDYSEQRYAVVVPAGAINRSYWVKISIKDKAKSASCTGDFKWLLTGCDEQSKDYLTISSLLFQETEVPGEYQASIESPGEYIGEIIFPSKVVGYNVTQIAESPLPDNQKALVKKVTIPDSITSINDNAFKDFTEIEYVTLDQNNVSVSSAAQASGLIKIGSSAFENCSSLRNFIIPSTIERIGAKAFKDCSALNEINIKNTEGWLVADSSTATSGISINSEDLSNPTIAKNYLTSTYVDKYWLNKEMQDDSIDPLSVLTFELNSDGNSYSVKSCNRSATGSLTIPSIYEGLPVTNIGDLAFIVCTGLTSIVIPDSVITIGTCLFQGCKGLKNVVIGSGVTIISTQIFDGCVNLTSITMCGEVTTIELWAFRDCESLTSINIPKSVTNIEGGASLPSCDGLTSITVESGNTKYHSVGNCIIETESKKLIAGCKTSVIPTDGSVTSIANYAFRGCTGLKSIEIPSSVTDLGFWTFTDCTNLKEIVIPDGVEYLNQELFSGCSVLTSVTIGEGVKHIGYKVFANCTSLTSITIPNSVENISDNSFEGCTSLTSVTFENPNGWYIVVAGIKERDLESTDLANESTAAVYLTSTYIDKIWIRSE